MSIDLSKFMTVNPNEKVLSLEQLREYYKIRNDVYNRVIKFMVDNKVSCVDSIYQCDWIIQNSYKFMADLFKMVESELLIEREDGEE